MSEKIAIRIGLVVTAPLFVTAGTLDGIYAALKYRDAKMFWRVLDGTLAWYQLLWDLKSLERHKISEYVDALKREEEEKIKE